MFVSIKEGQVPAIAAFKFVFYAFVCLRDICACACVFVSKDGQVPP